ncbi:MAG: hypothetical protein EOO73_21755 [Myxococcales bacterium]|nr:MAG: hypothetical protein EOO73_21755 [Myxococcales bacterium]
MLSVRGLRWVLTLSFGLLNASCGSRESMGDGSLRVLGAGVVNDPANKSLRFDMLKFGLDRFCEEMLKAGAALKLSDREPVLGRFYAESCQSQVIDEEARKSFVLQYTGKGYAWTNVTGKLGFTSRGLVEYAPDFQLSDGALYVYFRPKSVDAAVFQLLTVDSQLAQAGIAATAGQLSPDEVGKHVLDSQLKRGFTVIRYGNDGRTDFGVGYVPKGEKPYKPFDISTTKAVLVNERTEVHLQGQDYVGPLTVTDSGSALFVNLELDGADAVDYQLVPKAVGDAMLDRYVRSPGPCPQLAPPAFDSSAARGARAVQPVPLPVGQYYLVLDNSGALGRSQPPAAAAGDAAARVDYALLLGPRD